MKIEDVRRRDVEAMLDRIEAPVMRNRVTAFASGLFKAFGHWDWRTTENPVSRIPKVRENPRDRVLTVDEQRALMAAVDKLPNEIDRAFLRFLMWTGWRSGEALGLEWDWIEFPAADEPEAMTVIHLPDTKTGAQRRTVPPRVAALLVDLPRFANDPRVFVTVTYDSLKNRWRRICKAAGVEGARLHDLRRTYATSNAPHVGITVLSGTCSDTRRWRWRADTRGRQTRNSEEAQRAAADRQAALLDGKPKAPVEQFKAG